MFLVIANDTKRRRELAFGAASGFSKIKSVNRKEVAAAMLPSRYFFLPRLKQKILGRCRGPTVGLPVAVRVKVRTTRSY